MAASDQPHNFDGRLSTLETRVDGIVSTLDTVASAVGKMSDKLDHRSQPNWSVYIGGIGVLVTILGVLGASWKAPLDTAIVRQEIDIRKLQDSIVPREVHEMLRRQQDREGDDMRRRVERLEAHPKQP